MVRSQHERCYITRVAAETSGKSRWIQASVGQSVRPANYTLRKDETVSQKARSWGRFYLPRKRNGPRICRAVRNETAQHVAGISQANRCALSGARQSSIACKEPRRPLFALDPCDHSEPACLNIHAPHGSHSTDRRMIPHSTSHSSWSRSRSRNRRRPPSLSCRK
jgi:hypothetical protein